MSDARLSDRGLRDLLADPGDLAYWQAATGGAAASSAALERALARDILAHRGTHPATHLHWRRPMMLARAASRLRAGDEGPEGVRILSVEVPFAGFFAVEKMDLSFRRFDGSDSPPIPREVFISADAVTVLPYDPARDRVLLIEQMRTGPLARGAGRDVWQMEPVAGRIDPGETPEEAARREAVEEAGLTLGPLLPVAEFYPTTAGFSEYLYAYVGLCDLPDGVAGVHGVADEAEDIRGHLLPWAEVEARLAAGAYTNGPLILTLLWLQRERARLRAGAQGI